MQPSISAFQIGLESSEYIDTNYDYPFGLASFHILCPFDGDTTTIRQYFYGVQGSEQDVVRKWMPDGSYKTIPNYNLYGMPVGEDIVFLVEYQITDGGEFDDDGIADGVVRDPSGPGLPTAISSANSSIELAETGHRSSFYLSVAGLLIVISLSLIFSSKLSPKYSRIK